MPCRCRHRELLVVGRGRTAQAPLCDSVPLDRTATLGPAASLTAHCFVPGSWCGARCKAGAQEVFPSTKRRPQEQLSESVDVFSWSCAAFCCVDVPQFTFARFPGLVRFRL